MGRTILAKSWSDKRQAIMGAFGGSELDASVLLLPDLGLLPATDERFVKTCDLIGKELNRNGYIMRYTAADDFGAPETAFLTCQFWYIDALAAIGRGDAAGPSSPKFFRGATVSACCRRTSIRRPGSYGETCRKPIAWPGSSTPEGCCHGAGITPGRRWGLDPFRGC